MEACAQIVAPMLGSNAERAKDLAYRLYTLAERKGWAQEATPIMPSCGMAGNSVPRGELQQATPEQTSFF